MEITKEKDFVEFISKESSGSVKRAISSNLVNFNPMDKKLKFKKFLEEHLEKIVKCRITYCVCFKAILADDGFIYEASAFDKLISCTNRSPVTRAVISKNYKKINLVDKIVATFEKYNLEVLQDKYITDISFNEMFELLCSGLINGERMDFIYKIQNFYFGRVDNGHIFGEFLLKSSEKYQDKKTYLEYAKYILDHCDDLLNYEYCGMNVLHTFLRFCSCEELFEYLKLLFGRKNVNVVSLLKPDQAGMDPIHYAFGSGDMTRIDFIFKKLNIQMDDEMLHRYVRIAIGESRSEDFTIFLLEKIKNINVAENVSKLPLIVAIKAQQIQVIEYLLKRGAQTDIQVGDDKYQPIHYALMTGNSSVAKLLIDHCKDLELETYEDWRPIHCACYYCKAEVIEYLLKKHVKLINPIKQFKGSSASYLPISLLELNAKIDEKKMNELINIMFGIMEDQYNKKN